MHIGEQNFRKKVKKETFSYIIDNKAIHMWALTTTAGLKGTATFLVIAR